MSLKAKHKLYAKIRALLVLGREKQANILLLNIPKETRREVLEYILKETLGDLTALAKILKK